MEERKIPEEWKRVEPGEWWEFATSEGFFRTSGYTEYMLLSFLDDESKRIECDYKTRMDFVRNMRLRISEGIKQPTETR